MFNAVTGGFYQLFAAYTREFGADRGSLDLHLAYLIS